MVFYFFLLFVIYFNDIILSIIQKYTYIRKIWVDTPKCFFFYTQTHSKVWWHVLILYNDDDYDDYSLLRTMMVFKQQCCLKEEKTMLFKKMQKI